MKQPKDLTIICAILLSVIIGVLGGVGIAATLYQYSEPKDGGKWQIDLIHPDTLQIREGNEIKGKMFYTDDSELGYILQHGKN